MYCISFEARPYNIIASMRLTSLFAMRVIFLPIDMMEKSMDERGPMRSSRQECATGSLII